MRKRWLLTWSDEIENFHSRYILNYLLILESERELLSLTEIITYEMDFTLSI